MYILYMGGFRVSELGGGEGKGRLSFDDIFVPCTLTVVAKMAVLYGSHDSKLH